MILPPQLPSDFLSASKRVTATSLSTPPTRLSTCPRTGDAFDWSTNGATIESSTVSIERIAETLQTHECARTSEATIHEVDACCASTREKLQSLPAPLRHLSHAAFQKVLKHLPLHACAQLPPPLRLAALRDMLQPHACTPQPPTPLNSLNISDEGLSSVGCARLLHFVPLLPPIHSLTISHPRFLKYNVPRPANRRRLPAAEELWTRPGRGGYGGQRGRGRGGRGRGRGRGRNCNALQSDLDREETERKAVAQKLVDSRTCKGMQAVLYRAVQHLSPSLKHLSLARSTVNTRTLRVLCAKLLGLDSLDLSWCKFVRAEDLRPVGNAFALSGVYSHTEGPLAGSLTKSLSLLRGLKRLSLKGIPGVKSFPSACCVV